MLYDNHDCFMKYLVGCSMIIDHQQLDIVLSHCWKTTEAVAVALLAQAIITTKHLPPWPTYVWPGSICQKPPKEMPATAVQGVVDLAVLVDFSTVGKALKPSSMSER